MNNHLYLAGYTESSSGTLGAINYSGDNMFNSMFFLAKANLEGDFEFVKIPEHTQPSTASRIFKMDCDSNQNLYLTGYIAGALALDTVHISGNVYQNFLLKTDSAATGKWDITLNEFHDGLMTLAVRPDSSSVLLVNNKLLSVSASGELAPENQTLNYIDKTIYYDPTLENILIGGSKGGGLYKANYDNSLSFVSDISFTNNTGSIEFAGIVNDSLGNIYTYGYANGQNTFLGEQLETGAFLAKQDKEGTLLWLKHIPKAETASGTGDRIVIDPAHENVYIAGWFNEEISIPGGTTLIPGSTPGIYIVKYDAEGNFQYQTSFDDLDKNIDLSADCSGNLVFSNTFSGSIQVGSENYDGNADVIIIKLDPNGNIDWSIQAGGESTEYNGLSATDKHNNIYFTGEFLSENVTIGDSSRTLLEGDGNIFLAKIRTDGYIYWTRSHGKSVSADNPYEDYSCWATSIITMPEGYSYIKGWHGDSVSFSDTVLTNEYGYAYDYFIGLFDPNGEAVWVNTVDEKMYGMDYNQFDHDKEGNIYWGGQLKDTAYFVYYDNEYEYIPQDNNDLFIARYNRDGTLEWIKTLKSKNGYASIAGVAVADTNSIYINGEFEEYLAHESNEFYAPNTHGFIFRLGKETNNPYNISISSSKIEENLPVDTKIGGFTTSDPNNPDDNHSYSLIEGNGSNDADNDKFSIIADTLYSSVEFDYETTSSLHVLVQTTDNEGNTFAKAFTIEVEDQNEAPTDMELSGNSVAENMPVGTIVGELSTTDPDAGDEHSYNLISGDGSNDADNAKFTISENTIYTAEEFDYETQEIYHVYIQSRDTALYSISKAFEIVVTDEDETTGWQLPGDIPFQVFPNPFNNQLTIRSMENSKVMNNATLEIVSLNGQVLYQQSVSGLNEQTVHPGSLPNGIYILKIDTEQGSYRTKIIKQ